MTTGRINQVSIAAAAPLSEPKLARCTAVVLQNGCLAGGKLNAAEPRVSVFTFHTSDKQNNNSSLSRTEARPRDYSRYLLIKHCRYFAAVPVGARSRIRQAYKHKSSTSVRDQKARHISRQFERSATAPAGLEQQKPLETQPDELLQMQMKDCEAEYWNRPIVFLQPLASLRSRSLAGCSGDSHVQVCTTGHTCAQIRDGCPQNWWNQVKMSKTLAT